MRQTKTDICKLERSLVGKRNKKRQKISEKQLCHRIIHLTTGDYGNECDEEGFESEDVQMYPGKDVIEKALCRALEEELSQLQYVNHQNVQVHGGLLSLATGTLYCATFMSTGLT